MSLVVLTTGALSAQIFADSSQASQTPRPAPTPPVQQQPAPKAPAGPLPAASDAALATLRARIAKGDYRDAHAELKTFEQTAAVLRLRIDAALGLRDFADALASVDELRSVERKDDPALVSRIVRGIVEEIQGSPTDPMAQLEGCRVLLRRGTHPCAEALAKLAAAPTGPLAGRLDAAAVLAGAGERAWVDKFQALAAEATGPARRAAVYATRGLKPDAAVPVLVKALADTQSDVQVAAASMLGEQPSPESRNALTAYLQTNPGAAGTASARESLALLGDDASLQWLLGYLPKLQGWDLLRLGRALAARGDARATETLERAAKDDREVVRLAAGAALSTRKPDVAESALKAGLSHVNPLIRGAALQEYVDSPLLTAPRARGLLLDKDPMVRLQAADALLRRLEPSKGASAGRPAAASGAGTPRKTAKPRPPVKKN